MRIATESITTEWLRLDKGIIAGCTISVPLFIAAMNLLLGGVIVRFSIDPGTQRILRTLGKMGTWKRALYKNGKVRVCQHPEGEADGKRLKCPRIPTIQKTKGSDALNRNTTAL